MENSMKEHIKNIEELINEAKKYNLFEGNKYHEAIEHILKDYKRILKENEELKSQEETARKVNELLVERYSTSIPVQKVKDKMEELKEKEQELSDEQGYWGGSDLLAKIEVLQDLLERSREDE